MKKYLKTKVFFLTATLLSLGSCNAENKDFSKLDETFTQFLKEQDASEVKQKEETAPSLPAEESEKNQTTEEKESKEESNKVVANEDPEGKPAEESKLLACGDKEPERT